MAAAAVGAAPPLPYEVDEFHRQDHLDYHVTGWHLLVVTQEWTLDFELVHWYGKENQVMVSLDLMDSFQSDGEDPQCC